MYHVMLKATVWQLDSQVRVLKQQYSNLNARWNMQPLVWFVSLEIAFHWNGKSATFSWDNKAFSTVISLVLPLQWCLQGNNRILELTPDEFICFDLRFTGLLPRVRTSPPKCSCVNSSESHRMICSRNAICIIMDLKWRRRCSESVSLRKQTRKKRRLLSQAMNQCMTHKVSTIFIHRDCKQLYTWKGNSNCLETNINILSAKASFLVQTLKGFMHWWNTSC